MILNFLKDIKKNYLAEKRRRFLASHGCYTEEAYARKIDPATNQHATRIKDWYHGYTYVVTFDDPLSDIWTRYGDWLQSLDVIIKWCDENIKHGYRHDIHRVIEQGAIGLNNSTEYEWHINEIGGLDYVFFAFKDEADFLWFSLKWYE